MLPTEIQAVIFWRLIFPLELAVQVEERFRETDESKICFCIHIDSSRQLIEQKISH